MKVTELKELCEKATQKSIVVMRVADDREIVPITAWVDDNGLLVIEEAE